MPSTDPPGNPTAAPSTGAITAAAALAAGHPLVSFVCASRNDEYAPQLAKRHRLSLCTLLEQLDAYAIPAEYIVVEWNPPPHRPSLMDLLTPLPDSRMCSVRVITVPAEYHQHCLHWEQTAMHQAKALNVGFRRARGLFVNAIAVDAVYTDAVLENMRTLCLNRVYRVGRYDVDPAVLQPTFADRQALLDALQQHVVAHYPQKTYWAPIRSLYIHSSGDFMPAARERVQAVHGLEERYTFYLDNDSLLLHGLVNAGLEEQVWPSPCRVYKITHNAITVKRFAPHGARQWARQWAARQWARQWEVRQWARQRVVRGLSAVLAGLSRMPQQLWQVNTVRVIARRMPWMARSVSWLLQWMARSVSWLRHRLRRLYTISKRPFPPLPRTHARTGVVLPAFEHHVIDRVRTWEAGAPVQINGPDWGLGQVELAEVRCCTAQWENADAAPPATEKPGR